MARELTTTKLVGIILLIICIVIVIWVGYDMIYRFFFEQQLQPKAQLSTLCPHWVAKKCTTNPVEVQDICSDEVCLLELCKDAYENAKGAAAPNEEAALDYCKELCIGCP